MSASFIKITVQSYSSFFVTTQGNDFEIFHYKTVLLQWQQCFIIKWEIIDDDQSIIVEKLTSPAWVAPNMTMSDEIWCEDGVILWRKWWKITSEKMMEDDIRKWWKVTSVKLMSSPFPLLLGFAPSKAVDRRRPSTPAVPPSFSHPRPPRPCPNLYPRSGLLPILVLVLIHSCPNPVPISALITIIIMKM